jgi:hypothetical protein
MSATQVRRTRMHLSAHTDIGTASRQRSLSAAVTQPHPNPSPRSGCKGTSRGLRRPNSGGSGQLVVPSILSPPLQWSRGTVDPTLPPILGPQPRPWSSWRSGFACWPTPWVAVDKSRRCDLLRFGIHLGHGTLGSVFVIMGRRKVLRTSFVPNG